MKAYREQYDVESPDTIYLTTNVQNVENIENIERICDDLIVGRVSKTTMISRWLAFI